MPAFMICPWVRSSTPIRYGRYFSLFYSSIEKFSKQERQLDQTTYNCLQWIYQAGWSSLVTQLRPPQLLKFSLDCVQYFAHWTTKSLDISLPHLPPPTSQNKPEPSTQPMESVLCILLCPSHLGHSEGQSFVICFETTSSSGWPKQLQAFKIVFKKNKHQNNHLCNPTIVTDRIFLPLCSCLSSDY